MHRFVRVLPICLAVAACDDAGPNVSGVDPIAIARIEVIPALDTIWVGDTVAAALPRAFEGVAIGRAGTPLDILLAWQSSNPAVATVDDFGVVQPVGLGSAQIIASAGKTASATVVVERGVAAVELLLPSAAVVGNQAQLEVVAFAPNGELVRGVAYTWSSSDPAVATVDESGVATFVAPGTTTITVSGGGRSVQRTLTVVAA